MNQDFKSHIDDIIKALSEKSEEVSREELESELSRFMEYGVPIEQAKQTLIKKFGGIAVFTTSGQSSERKMISELQPNQRSVNLLGRIITVNPKEITVKGDNKKIFYGIIGDESGTIPFTSWNSEFNFEKGDVVKISNAYTREWQDSVQLNFGDRVNITKTDKDELQESAFVPKEFKVKDLRSGLGSVEITARILEINEREAEVGGVTKKVYSGIIADDTGKAQFTSWHDFKLKEGDVFKITGGYIKSWKGIPQLTFDEKATVKKVDKGKIPKKDLELVKMPLFKLIEKRGALDIEAMGTIIEIRPGSGVITRCPQCNRTFQNGECSIHGKVKGKEDLRLKLIIDDGTGSVSSILNKEISEKLLGKSLEECKKITENDLENMINKTLFAQTVNVRGNALGDDFGTSIIAKDAKIVDIDVQDEAEKLSQKLEDLL